MKTFKKIFDLLSHQERKQVFYLLIMILFMALLDVIGIASIMPFIAVLTNPDLIESNVLINKLYNYSNLFGVKTNEQFLFSLGVLVFFLLVFSLAFKALLAYSQLRFSAMCQYGLSKRLMERYLNQPYSWFLSRHSAEIGKTVLSEVGIIVTKGLKPILNIITHGTVAFAILILLIFNEPKFSLIACTSLSLTYFLIYRLTRNFLMRIGHERVKAVQDRFMVVTEAFNAAKELKVGNLERAFLERFSIPAKNLAKYSAIAGSISQLPRYALEIIAFGGMLLLILFLMGQNTFNSVLPLIALYVFAGYRLIPALQQIYASITMLRFVSPSLNATHKDYKSLDPNTPKRIDNLISLTRGITINDLYYQYPNSLKTTIKDINLNIPANSTVGIVGSTGSGKTTVVDIILGLLQAQKGTLKVDDITIDENNIVAWQQSIGYVPQDIFIADDTLDANIAFGVDKKNINKNHVQLAAKIANIHDFIDKLPLKYQTTVGERGVRLSGGERQRIGIARALYSNPKILILDEATSALDNLTEQLVMQEIHKTSSNKTIIMIAHRLSTVKKCDIIFYLEKGEIKAQGTYEELIENSEGFKKIENK